MSWSTCLLVLAFLLSGPTARAATDAASPYESTAVGTADSLPRSYAPPMLSNGSLCMQVDYQGCQFQKTYAGMIPCIYWAGRRYGPPKDLLIPFGHFEQELSCNGQTFKTPARWKQTLNTKNALTTCQCDYGDLFSVETTVFVPLEPGHRGHSQAIPSDQSGGTQRAHGVQIRLLVARPQAIAAARSAIAPEWNAAASSVDVKYQVDGYRVYDGLLSVVSDRPATGRIDGRRSP